MLFWWSNILPRVEFSEIFMNIFNHRSKAKLRFGLGSFACASLFLVTTSEVMAQGGPAVVEVQPITSMEVAATQSVVGTVSPTRRAVIGSAVDGRVVEFLVREGDRVEADQPLARLLTQTIELELEAAEAELELMEQELAELVNGSRPEEIAQAKARVEASRAAAEYMASEEQRLSGLAASSAVSVSELEGIVSKAFEARERLAEAEAAYRLAVEGPRSERIAQARAQVAIRDAIVRRLSDQIIKHTMFARFSGYVTVEHTEVGEWLPRGEPVAEIIALDEVDVITKVVESHIPFVHVGDEMPVQISALPGESFTGRVVAIVPQADVRSRTFPVKVRVINRFSDSGEPLIKAGMLARVTLATKRTQESFMVPKDALVLSGEAAVIWVIDSASIRDASESMKIANAAPVPVRTGIEEEELIEVIGTFDPKGWVVVRGNERIIPGRPGGPPAQVTWVASQL
jgi:RND family efflux transporter MFP subunit